MEKLIRLLTDEDYPHLEAMDTGMKDDYVQRVFPRLVRGNNRLYGLFLDGQLVSIGGYSIYAKHHAMLGRLRSDRRFRGSDLATELMSYVMQEAFRSEDIQWVGANTQEDNAAARRVLEKLKLKKLTALHGALTKDTSALVAGAKTWNEVHDLQRKKEWVHQAYVENSNLFPYECYYPFPASWELFNNEDLQKWSFYENDKQTRFLITKTDQKKHYYLHAVYPWSDITNQAGLWETISKDYEKVLKQTKSEAYIWMDLTKEEAQTLPPNHSFQLPSPWILHGMNKREWNQTGACHSPKFVEPQSPTAP
ncbi:GNAT family N-acetyltransferase [Oceanobacillus halophilus]|uniref:N-acetyltransferase n=1 Tax=Oceanobacillus halophilus TaxID=930130 RepID=A0A495A4U8_9BACI|nr:GNAT family N-acetyltransferase [Oceanobacillus halophilus]RKQ34672.1 N-acetyltransferase [Oceanobacillus halophilus]